MPKEIGQSKTEMSAPDNLAVLELKANLNSEQREYLEVLKAKMKKILSSKTKQELAKAGDLTSLNSYKAVLTEILEFLKTKEIRQSELEKKFELKKQYDEQFKILKETGVIKKLKDGQWGMIDILDQEQPIPSYEEIKARMEVSSELLNKKMEQGFTKLLLVPFGMKLSDLIVRAGELMAKKYKEGVLVSTNGKTLDLVAGRPVHVHEIYNNADVNGNLVYDVKKFDRVNHGGLTKMEKIAKNNGWDCVLFENNAVLPREGESKNIAGRQQFEERQTPEQYLEKIQTDSDYQGEQFSTPEFQLAFLIKNLYEKNQIIDDWLGNGLQGWNAGAYFKNENYVPAGCWHRDHSKFVLAWSSPEVNMNGSACVRSFVKF